MDLLYLLKFIIFLIIPLKIFIIPICIVIINLVILFTVKNTIKKAGINYFTEEKIKIKFKISMYIIFGMNIVLFIMSIIFKQWITSILTIFLIMALLKENLSQKLYGSISGIYENGIIDENYFLRVWDKIHSYKIVENDLFGYFNNGNAFKYINLININEIKELFIRKKIVERK